MIKIIIFLIGLILGTSIILAEPVVLDSIENVELDLNPIIRLGQAPFVCSRNLCEFNADVFFYGNVSINGTVFNVSVVHYNVTGTVYADAFVGDGSGLFGILHNNLVNLDWSDAEHIINTDVDMNFNDILNLSNITTNEYGKFRIHLQNDTTGDFAYIEFWVGSPVANPYIRLRVLDGGGTDSLLDVDSDGVTITREFVMSSNRKFILGANGAIIVHDTVGTPPTLNIGVKYEFGQGGNIQFMESDDIDSANRDAIENTPDTILTLWGGDETDSGDYVRLYYRSATDIIHLDTGDGDIFEFDVDILNMTSGNITDVNNIFADGNIIVQNITAQNFLTLISPIGNNNATIEVNDPAGGFTITNENTDGDIAIWTKNLNDVLFQVLAFDPDQSKIIFNAGDDDTVSRIEFDFDSGFGRGLSNLKFRSGIGSAGINMFSDDTEWLTLNFDTGVQTPYALEHTEGGTMSASNTGLYFDDDYIKLEAGGQPFIIMDEGATDTMQFNVSTYQDDNINSYYGSANDISVGYDSQSFNDTCEVGNCNRSFIGFDIIDFFISNLITTGNITANTYFGDGSQLTGIIGDNISWNVTTANALYLPHTSADNASWNVTTANLLYSPINYGDEWNKTYADTLYANINVVTDNASWNVTTANALYLPHTSPDNASWNVTTADTLYRSSTNYTFIGSGYPAHIFVDTSGSGAPIMVNDTGGDGYVYYILSSGGYDSYIGIEGVDLSIYSPDGAGGKILFKVDSGTGMTINSDGRVDFAQALMGSASHNIQIDDDGIMTFSGNAKIGGNAFEVGVSDIDISADEINLTGNFSITATNVTFNNGLPVTGGNAGTSVCIDANNMLCACGSCA